jgi:rod shape-determining protein MreD
VKVVGIVLGVIVALALQTTLMRYLVGGRLAVDLVLVAVVYASLVGGPVSGLITGTIAGLTQDALSVGIIGIGGLAKTVVGFLAGVIGRQFIVAQSPSRFVVFFASTLLHAAIFMGLQQLLGLRTFDNPYGAVVGQGLANAVIGVLAFKLTEFLPGAVERRRLGRGRSRR